MTQGCGGRSGAESAPAAALAGSRSTQEAFRPLKQQFISSNRARRALLEANLNWFVTSYPKDGQVPLAKVYLALISVDRGDLERAQRLVREIGTGSGTTRDLADLVDGAIFLRRQAPATALERFLPLVGKLIDPYARMLLDEYIVAAAIGAGRWYEAVAYMDLWLRDAQDETAQSARAQVKQSLEAVPSGALELMLQSMRSESARAGYGVEIRNAIVARLAAVALEEQDTALARRLVESTGNSQALGEAAEGLSELASSGGAATVDGRTIGLLISTGKSHLGARAADVLAGVVDALRLTGEGGGDHVRLTTRDERDTKRTELALFALASQGASLLIAGLDAPQAEIAASFAERTHIPVILLSAHGDGHPRDRDTFVLGEAADGANLALADALASHGARVVAPVGGSIPAGKTRKVTFVQAASCSAPTNQAGESRFPLEGWRLAKVDYLLFLGDAACASEAIADALSAKIGAIRAAVGLEAAEIAAEPTRVPLLLATAGRFPLKRSDTSSGMSGFKKRHGKAPSWWTALGHDAAVLARAALRTLPADRTGDIKEVETRHAAASSALTRAEGELWTTEARGFAGQPAISRQINVIEVR